MYRLILILSFVPSVLMGQWNVTHQGKTVTHNGSIVRGAPWMIPANSGRINPAPTPTGDSLWYDLAHDLYVHVPESQVANDRILECTPNRQWIAMKGYEWSKLSGSTDFSFSDSLLVATTGLTVGTYQIQYLLKDSIVWDTASIYVTVTDDSDNYYIDLDWTGTESGTRAQPYNSFTDFSFASNKNYYVKRGSSITTSGNINITSVNHVVLGAYGAGERPEYYTSFTTNNLGAIDISSCDNVFVESIYQENTAVNHTGWSDNCYNTIWYGGSFANVYINGSSDSVFVDNCVLQGTDYDHLTYNAVRIVGGEFVWGGFRNCEIAWSLQDGIYALNAHGTSAERYQLVANYIHDIQYSSDLNPGYVSCSSAGDCIDFMGYDEGSKSAGNAQYTWIAYNLADRSNTYYKHGIKYGNDPTISDTQPTYSIIEYNRVNGWSGPDTKGQNLYSLYYARGTIFRYNISQEGTVGLWWASENSEQQNDPDNHYVEAYGNLFINPSIRGVSFSGNSDHGEFYNNTVIMTDVQADVPSLIDGQCAVQISANATDIESRNNIYYLNDADIDAGMIDGGSGMDDDYDMWLNAYGWSYGANSVVDDPEFISDYTPWGTYGISITSPAYLQGTDVGLDADAYGVDWGVNPSLGFKEPTIISE